MGLFTKPQCGFLDPGVNRSRGPPPDLFLDSRGVRPKRSGKTQKFFLSPAGNGKQPQPRHGDIIQARPDRKRVGQLPNQLGRGQSFRVGNQKRFSGSPRVGQRVQDSFDQIVHEENAASIPDGAQRERHPLRDPAHQLKKTAFDSGTVHKGRAKDNRLHAGSIGYFPKRGLGFHFACRVIGARAERIGLPDGGFAGLPVNFDRTEKHKAPDAGASCTAGQVRGSCSIDPINLSHGSGFPRRTRDTRQVDDSLYLLQGFSPIGMRTDLSYISPGYAF